MGCGLRVLVVCFSNMMDGTLYWKKLISGLEQQHPLHQRQKIATKHSSYLELLWMDCFNSQESAYFLFGLKARIMQQDDEEWQKTSRIPLPNFYLMNLQVGKHIQNEGSAPSFVTINGLQISYEQWQSKNEQEVQEELAQLRNQEERDMEHTPQMFDSNVRKKRCCMKQEILFIANAINTYELLEARRQDIPLELKWVRHLHYHYERFLLSFQDQFQRLAVHLKKNITIEEEFNDLERFLDYIGLNFLSKTADYSFKEVWHECTAVKSKQESCYIIQLADYRLDYQPDYCHPTAE